MTGKVIYKVTIINSVNKIITLIRIMDKMY